MAIANSISSRHSKGHLIGPVERVSIRSDNSCLFSCFSFLLHIDERNHNVRQIAADEIRSDPDTFSDVALEKARDAYIDWIKEPNSWGGYIELIALSKAYRIQVVAVDEDSGRLDEYGDANATRRIYLLYDGSHYDAVWGLDECCPGKYVCTFDPADKVILNKVSL